MKLGMLTVSFIREKFSSLGFAQKIIIPVFCNLILAIAIVVSVTFIKQTNSHETNLFLLKYFIYFFCFSSLAISIISIICLKKTTKRLSVLSKSAELIEKKDYSVSIDDNLNDEIGFLAKSFNRITKDIRKYIENVDLTVKNRTKDLELASQEIIKLNEQLKKDNLRLGAEVVIAKQLQMMVLPGRDELTNLVDFDIIGFMHPADEVGGDYYDVLRDPKTKMLKIGIGDVTGHGLESGVMMLMVQTIAKTLLDVGIRNPVEFLTLINRIVCSNNERIKTDKNLTLLFADFYEDKVEITGQHEEILFIKKSGEFEVIDTMSLGMPIGLFDGVEQFTMTRTIPLESGDTMIFYTDGITEGENSSGEQYGCARLHEIVKKCYQEDAAGIRDHVVRDVLTFIGNKSIMDDITLLVVKKK